MSRIIYNAIRTPDGTVLESKYRHDCVTYTDKNGYRYGVDGGCSYLRRIGNRTDYTDLSLTDDEPHETQIKVLKWGSRGKDGKQPLKYKPIKDMETDHIQKVLDMFGTSMSVVHKNCMEEELKRRIRKG